MLTGDTRVSAEAVARTLGIDEVIADVLPDQKAQAIKRLQAQGRIVAMAGDGVNAAPALAQVLYPFFGLLLSPMLAAAAMSLSSVSVISNALRLKRARV